MRKGWVGLSCGLLAAALAANLCGQSYNAADSEGPNSITSEVKGKCACGAHSVPKPKDRVVTPYAGEPVDLSPYSKFAAPYDLNYIHPNIYSGAARDFPSRKTSRKCASASLVPSRPIRRQFSAQRMLHGAQLAMEEANARGGYGGQPLS